jgi:hypothetical protein
VLRPGKRLARAVRGAPPARQRKSAATFVAALPFRSPDRFVR